MVKLDIAELERAGSASATNDTAAWHRTRGPDLRIRDAKEHRLPDVHPV